jgi:hypothetical protein
MGTHPTDDSFVAISPHPPSLFSRKGKSEMAPAFSVGCAARCRERLATCLVGTLLAHCLLGIWTSEDDIWNGIKFPRDSARKSLSIYAPLTTPWLIIHRRFYPNASITGSSYDQYLVSALSARTADGTHVVIEALISISADLFPNHVSKRNAVDRIYSD